MGGLEITLLVIGLIIIAASYVISERLTDTTEAAKEFETVEDYEKRKEVEESVKSRLERMAEEAIEKTDATICRLSNEKIMAVNEYGDMVLERIDKNHSEVVFLYSMLTEKEKELKQLMCNPSVDAKESTSEEEIPITIEPIIPEICLQQEEETQLVSEKHERILSYLRKGKSVLEISKELELGQGEVQLVANLYAGGNRK